MILVNFCTWGGYTLAPMFKRDCVIAYALQHGLTVYECDELLFEQGLATLS